MNRTTVGALVVFLVGVIVIAGVYLWKQSVEESTEISTSDAARAQGTITIGVDNFVGYFPLCSPHMHQLMLADGWALDCVDDSADYAGRFSRLQSGELDLAVATVDSYVLGGQRANYPAVIVAVIDASAGGDAILAREDVATSLTDLRDRPGLRVAYTPNSPSHHLLKAVGIDFDVPFFGTQEGAARQIETNGSEEARRLLVSGDADIAVLWEPDVSRALAEDGIVSLLGSEQTSGLIVDILLANRDYQNNHPDRVQLLLENYFRTLKFYQDNPEDFNAAIAMSADVPADLAEHMRNGVAWANLTENATAWLGVRVPNRVPQYGLIDTIGSTVRILIGFGDVPASPLPGGDPRRIINSEAVATLYSQGIQPDAGTGGTFLQEASASSLEADFPPLADAGWDRLREVATLQVRPIHFQSGVNTLTREDKEQLDQAAQALENYPAFRIEVQGHTSLQGDPEANRQLSQARARAVAQYLQVTYGIDADRIRVVGLGSTAPLPQRPGEPFRSYRDRLARVEIHLKSEEY